MKLRLIIFILAASQLAAVHGQGKKERAVKKAQKIFRTGKLEQADKKFSELFQTWPGDMEIQYKLAELAVLSNRFQQAENILSTILKQKPQDSVASRLLAEVLYRQDKFDKVPDLLLAAGRDIKAEQIRYFQEKSRSPYRMSATFEREILELVTVDFLPSVRVKINGKEGLFIIDTGGGETIIDTDFAKEAGAVTFGESSGVYAGGSKAKFTHGFVDAMELGALKIENVPVHLMSVKQFSAAVGGQEVSGIIGTIFLYHFLSTLDYNGAKLILEKSGTKVSKSKAIPFWLASDHLMIAQGAVGNATDQLFLVDTGMAGAGFTCPRSTLDQAGIELQNQQAFEGEGGAGKVSVTPFMIDKLSLGEVTGKSIMGLYGAFPPQLEQSLGFRIGGLISHSFFRPYKVTFDFVNMRIYAESN